MTERPETRFARSGDAHIAYHVIGDAPTTLVGVVGMFTNLRVAWEEPRLRAFNERLGQFTRLVVYDERGNGLSDPVVGDHLPTLEERAADLRAVMDAAGVERAVVYGHADGGPVSIVFATQYPERVEGLVLGSSYARMLRSDDYPIGHTEEAFEAWLELTVKAYDDEQAARAHTRFMNPSVSGDEGFRQHRDALREVLSPGQAVARARTFVQSDVRSLLALLSVPTLVLHRVGDRATPVEHARYLAAHIAGARLVELPGDDNSPVVGDVDAWIGEIEEFVTGARAMPAPTQRVLATVLFTDIVGSTERAAAMGDGPWKELLDQHDDAVRRQIERFGGVEVKTTGDGFLVTFDGSARSIQCASAIRAVAGQLGLTVRAGIHAGEVERRGADISGLAVHVAERISALAGPSEILVSGTVRDLVVGSGIEFDDRGTHELKGVPDEWRVLAVAT